MQKIRFGIFAHPDDETFGPAATLLKEVQNGVELHLVCVTRGENGDNPDNAADLGAVREQEWRAAGKAIGATGMHMLGYQDGTLCNNLYHEIAKKIEAIVQDTASKAGQPTISFMTLDPNGITGHLDHIAVSNITTYLFYKLKAAKPPEVKVSELAYFCLPQEDFPEPSVSYVFMPPGRPQTYINRRVDVGRLLQTKYKIMRLHNSQRRDVESNIAFGDNHHSTDNFHVT